MKYFSRSVPASYITKPFDFCLDLSGYGSFEARIIREDAQKEVARFFRDPPDFDCMVCDFISSARLGLYELEGGGIGTLTPQLKKLFGDRVPFSRIERTSDRYIQLHNKGLELFMSFVENSRKNSIILINKVYLSNNNNDGSKSKHPIDNYNSILDEIYSNIENRFGKNIFLCYTDKEMICDVSHKWSHAPFHYIKDFYVKQSLQILNRLDVRSL